jgi:diguanylate cyclase (GGDEF)-like protein
VTDRFTGIVHALAFLVLTSIVVAVGHLGLGAMERLHADAKNLADTQWEDVQLAVEALDYSNQNNRVTMQLFITNDRPEIDLLLAHREENNAKISALLKLLQTRIRSAKEQELLNGIVETRSDYVESTRHAIDILLKQKGGNGARQSPTLVTSPLLAKYHVTWSDFIRFQTEEMNQQLDRSAGTYALDRKRTTYLIIFAVLLALGIAVFEVRTIVIEIRRRTTVEGSMRSMNEGLELRVLHRTAALDKSNKDLIAEIAQRKKVEESLVSKTVFLEAQANSTMDGILVVDPNNRKLLQNQRFIDLFQLPRSAVEDDDDKTALEYVLAKVAEPEQFVQKVGYLYDHSEETSRDEIRLKTGTVLDRYSSPVVGADGQYYGRIWTFRDITDRKLAEERIKYLAFYDALTGLPNRVLLQDRLATALSGARRRKSKVALLFFDLDRFKLTNDSLGHAAGDLLLQEVANRFKSYTREQDTVARIGGDEFLIVLTDVEKIADAAIAAERLMHAMTVAFVIHDHPLNIGCSIGISIFPEHGADAEALLKNADAAMYSAKENGRNNFQFFTDDMNADVVERSTLENSLRLALEKEELFLMYQPQMDIATGNITGLEALIRWQHPDLGLVAPDKFIPIAESSGLIRTIGEWVLRTACGQARKWQEEGLPAISVAVNVSAVQFRHEGFCGLIRRVLHETGLAPQYLELELTESLLLADADITFSVLQELKAMGLTLAIDDFGTGYSSFSYLRQFRVSKLKIDRSFIRDVAVNTDDAAITTAIISMAKSLRLKVIAEGVEDEAQMSFLRLHQCDGIQGYYFSKPLSAAMAADKLRATLVQSMSASVAIASK